MAGMRGDADHLAGCSDGEHNAAKGPAHEIAPLLYDRSGSELVVRRFRAPFE